MIISNQRYDFRASLAAWQGLAIVTGVPCYYYWLWINRNNQKVNRCKPIKLEKSAPGSKRYLSHTLHLKAKGHIVSTNFFESRDINSIRQRFCAVNSDHRDPWTMRFPNTPSQFAHQGQKCWAQRQRWCVLSGSICGKHYKISETSDLLTPICLSLPIIIF